MNLSKYSKILMVHMVAILICVSAYKPGWTDTDPLETISADFGPLNGYIVSVNGDEYLVDLDKFHGVQIGDLFSVIEPGEEIIHPVTGKLIGVTKEVRGVVKISSIRDGFSFARALKQNLLIEKGDKVIRYGNFECYFYDYTGQGRDLYAGIQKKLPAFKWNGYEEANEGERLKPEKTSSITSTLIFLLYSHVLEIRDFEFTLLKSYYLNSNEAIEAAFPTAKTMEFKTESTLPSPAVISDFLSWDDRLLLASTNGLEIQIVHLSNTAERIATVKPSYYTKILAVKWWQPDISKPPYIAATIWADKKVEGILYRFENNQLSVEIEGIFKILGTFDLDGDLVPETLLGQNFDGETFFGQKIEKLTRSDNKLKPEHYSKKLPKGFSVLGSAIADLTGDGAPESIFVRNSILYIYSIKNMLYKSASDMGGSVSFLMYDVDSSDINSKPATVSIEVSPIVLDMDQDGILELFTVASKKSLFGKLGTAPGIEKSGLRLIDYRNGRFVIHEIGKETELSMQGLFTNGKRVLTIGTMANSYDIHGWTSYLLSLML